MQYDTFEAWAREHFPFLINEHHEKANALAFIVGKMAWDQANLQSKAEAQVSGNLKQYVHEVRPCGMHF
jgi:hypothetical protein